MWFAERRVTPTMGYTLDAFEQTEWSSRGEGPFPGKVKTNYNMFHLCLYVRLCGCFLLDWVGGSRKLLMDSLIVVKDFSKESMQRQGWTEQLPKNRGQSMKYGQRFPSGKDEDVVFKKDGDTCFLERVRSVIVPFLHGLTEDLPWKKKKTVVNPPPLSIFHVQLQVSTWLSELLVLRPGSLLPSLLCYPTGYCKGSSSLF